jgi:hypothetical protein
VINSSQIFLLFPRLAILDYSSDIDETYDKEVQETFQECTTVHLFNKPKDQSGLEVGSPGLEVCGLCCASYKQV